jgi:hypothetical protein
MARMAGAIAQAWRPRMLMADVNILALRPQLVMSDRDGADTREELVGAILLVEDEIRSRPTVLAD